MLSPGYFQHVYRPEEVGPIWVQVPNGVIDILVEDEAEAVSVTRQYMSYSQGRIEEWNCADQRGLRHVVAESRLRSYNMRTVLETLADDDFMREIREVLVTA